MDRIHIEKEIEEIRTPELFLAYHPNSHVFSRHYYVTQEELQQRTCKLHFHPGEIICMSRFTEATKSEVTSLIADGLSLHIQEIMDWGKRDPFHAFDKLSAAFCQLVIQHGQEHPVTIIQCCFPVPEPFIGQGTHIQVLYTNICILLGYRS